MPDLRVRRIGGVVSKRRVVVPPFVRVVIVNFNSGPWLRRAVQALAAQNFRDFEAVIVDNASTDESFSGLGLHDDRFSLVNAGANLGFAAGCNLGARGAATPWLAMLNPDALAAPDWLDRLAAAVERYPGVPCFGSTQILAESPHLLDGCGDNYSIFGLAWRSGHGEPVTAGRDCRVFSPCAAAALYRRDVFEAVGGFEPSFFCYLEDVDLGFRLRLAGYEVVQVADAVVHHAGSASSGRRSAFTIGHSTRNGVWLMLRCLPMALLVLAVPLYLLSQFALMARRPQDVGKRLAGLWRSLAGIGRAWRQRRRLQDGRKVGVAAITGWLAWNPAVVFRRKRVHLPARRTKAVDQSSCL